MMLRSLSSALVAASVLFGSVATAEAAIIQADFREELDLPDYRPQGARILAADDRAVGAGFELTEADQIANPAGWGDSLNVDLDPTQNLLTLSPTAANSYQTISLIIDDIRFSLAEEILSFALLTNTAISGDPFTIDTAFTGQSLMVNIAIDNLGSGDYFSLLSGGSMTFGYTLGTSDTGSTPVPVPGSLALLGLGLLGAGLVVRRKRA